MCLCHTKGTRLSDALLHTPKVSATDKETGPAKVVSRTISFQDGGQKKMGDQQESDEV